MKTVARCWSYAINNTVGQLTIDGETFTFRRYPGDQYDLIFESIRLDDNGELVCDMDGVQPVSELLALAQ